MSDEEYFSEKYKDYISNSKLGLFNYEEGGSPAKFNEGFKGGYSESFELGSAVHGVLLQPDEFEVSEIRKPGGKLGAFAERVFALRKEGLSIENAMTAASEQIDYYAKSFSDKRVKAAILGSIGFYSKLMHFKPEKEGVNYFHLSDSLYEKYDNCLESVNKSDIPKKLYPDGLLSKPESYNEYAVLCEVFIDTGESIERLKLKAKIDNFTIDHQQQVITLNDLKTTGKPVRYFMGNEVFNNGKKIWYDGSFQKFHYYRQMGMYGWLLKNALKELMGYHYKMHCNMLVVGTIPDYDAAVYPVKVEHIVKGLNEFKKLLVTLAKWQNSTQ